jgi:ABC-type multidrug transport system fused ATPase/permease subunit
MTLTTEPTTRTLPVSSMASVAAHTRGLLREHRGTMTKVVGLHALAATAALAAPRLVGDLVDAVTTGTTRAHIDTLSTWLAVSVLLQTVLMWAARRASFIMGETVFAQLREQFIGRVTSLPLSTVERAGTGDLVSRTTNDVEALSHVVRFGIPSLFVAVVTTTLTVVAAVVTGPVVALPIVLGVPIIWVSTRRYLRLAPDGYLRERATYAVANGVITETVDGARTVDALGLGARAAASRPRATRCGCGCAGSPRSSSPTSCRSPAPWCGAAGWSRPVTPRSARSPPSCSTSSR